MSAQKYDFKVDVGSTTTIPLRFTDSSGTALDMSGYTFEMQCRQTPSSETVLFEVSSSDGIDMSAAATGWVTITISKTKTSAVAVRTGVYDLERTLGAETVRVIQGNVSFSPEVTRG
tara:strand:- start:4813 stop:5163 length:351 start_codon:yes stop_codon:yes gene_type:complete